MKIQNISYEISDYNSAYAVEIKFKCFNRSISVLNANVQCFFNLVNYMLQPEPSQKVIYHFFDGSGQYGENELSYNTLSKW